jgi:hypothetical protein
MRPPVQPAGMAKGKCETTSSTVTVFREGVRHRSILIAFGEAEIAPSPYANDRYATPHYAAKPW